MNKCLEAFHRLHGPIRDIERIDGWMVIVFERRWPDLYDPRSKQLMNESYRKLSMCELRQGK